MGFGDTISMKALLTTDTILGAIDSTSTEASCVVRLRFSRTKLGLE